MMTPEQRQSAYSKMLRFMTKNGLNTVPLDLPALCSSLGIDLVPLSRIMNDTGLTAQEVFAIWGNEDGAVNMCGGTHRIAYNDRLPQGRIRFTLCEELAHVVYAHTADPDFNIFFQRYAPGKYANYDEEARLGAGFLICHPKFYYTHERLLTPKHLSEICNITLPCARARCEIYAKYRDEIKNNFTYQFAKIPTTPINLWKYERICRRQIS